MRRSSSLALPCFAAALFACHSDQTSLTREQLLDPQSCAGCHQDQFQEWEGSMHAYSSNDPVFLAQHAFSLNYEAERWKAIRFETIKDYQVRDKAA